MFFFFPLPSGWPRQVFFFWRGGGGYLNGVLFKGRNFQLHLKLFLNPLLLGTKNCRCSAIKTLASKLDQAAFSRENIHAHARKKNGMGQNMRRIHVQFELQDMRSAIRMHATGSEEQNSKSCKHAQKNGMN